MWSFGRYARNYIGARLLYNLGRALLGMTMMAGGLWATREALEDPASIPGMVARLVEVVQTLRGSVISTPAPGPEALRPSARPKPALGTVAPPASAGSRAAAALGARVLLAVVALTLYMGPAIRGLVRVVRGLSLIAGLAGLAAAGTSETLILSLGLITLSLVYVVGGGPAERTRCDLRHAQDDGI